MLYGIITALDVLTTVLAIEVQISNDAVNRPSDLSDYPQRPSSTR
jgi:hypothetical protein